MEQLLNDQNFQNKLKEIAKAQKSSLELLMEEAKGYLKEMYTVHQPLANLMGVQTAQYHWPI